jgi:aldose 1-epimerase
MMEYVFMMKILFYIIAIYFTREVFFMSTSYAREGHYQGEEAVLIGFGSYTAVMLPGIGGNLISFRDEENGYHILREPTAEDWSSFVKRPMIHGIPVLFPPNR